MNKSENTSMMKEIIRDYLFDNIDIEELDNEEDLVEYGIINSLFAIQMTTFLEKEFGIKITLDDMDMENFKSVNSLLGMVKAKQALNNR
jgi:methoxymalonate biosynthesis acyl carrier protein